MWFSERVHFSNRGGEGNADFGSHALLHEGTELALIVDLDDLLRPIGRVGDVELHLDGAARSRRRARVCRQVDEVQVVGDSFFVGFFWWCSEISLCGRMTNATSPLRASALGRALMSADGT